MKFQAETDLKPGNNWKQQGSNHTQRNHGCDLEERDASPKWAGGA
jgi:hypothetical protein